MSALQGLSHDQLLIQLRDLIQRDHTLEAELIAYLAEVDARRLYLEQACPSMFHYCVHVLHFAEGVAYKRITVARATREFPKLLVALEQGRLHLTAASLLAPHLNRECATEWLEAACHKTAREIKQWIANRKPKADVKTSIRKSPTARLTADMSKGAAPSERGPTRASVTGLPRTVPRHAAAAADRIVPDASAPTTAAPRVAAQGNRTSSAPLGANRYCVRFTIDAVVHEELQELRALLRHQIPDGDVAKIIGRAVHALLEQARRQKRGACSPARVSRSSQASAMPGPGFSAATAGTDTSTPASGAITPAPEAPSKRPSRKIPTAIRRAVWERDGGRCSYVSRKGRQCGARDFLEFHHQVPWARCREHRESNIQLRCRSHNQHAAELDFGAQHMAACRKRRGTSAANDAVVESATEPWVQQDSNPAGVASADRGAVP